VNVRASLTARRGRAHLEGSRHRLRPRARELENLVGGRLRRTARSRALRLDPARSLRHKAHILLAADCTFGASGEGERVKLHAKGTADAGKDAHVSGSARRKLACETSRPSGKKGRAPPAGASSGRGRPRQPAPISMDAAQGGRRSTVVDNGQTALERIGRRAVDLMLMACHAGDGRLQRTRAACEHSRHPPDRRASPRTRWPAMREKGLDAGLQRVNLPPIDSRGRARVDSRA